MKAENNIIEKSNLLKVKEGTEKGLVNLSLVVPFFNEKKRVIQGCSTLFNFLKIEDFSALGKDFFLEIVFVDDGSSDDSPIMIKKETEEFLSNNPNMLKRVKFTFTGHYPNQGKGGAIKKGVSKAKGKYILYTDFDFSISLNEIIPFYLELSGASFKRGLVIASRRVETSVLINQSFLRKWVGRIFNFSMKIIMNLPVKDTQCGFKMFDRKTGQIIFSDLFIKGFAFDVEVIKKAYLLKVPVIERGVEIFFADKTSTVNIYTDPPKMLLSLLGLRFYLILNRVLGRGFFQYLQ